ncbi:MAG TPA: hypothetical protein VN643_18720 [Pyrinomonadaceae bacterium]|nr:hypothetical protein [Pyrinomonadaceae bacterium]
MCIPIVLVYGYRKTLVPLGWTARECHRCRRVQAFEVYEEMQENHIYYIHGKAKSIGRIVICDFCETSIGLKPKSKEAKEMMMNTWRRKDGLQALIDKTNPKLGQIRIPEKPTREELFALLESVNERTNPYSIDTGGNGAFLAGLIGGVAGALLLLGLNAIGAFTALDSLGSGMLGAVLGILAGVIVGTVKEKFRRARDLAQEILVASMQRNSITLDTLERALKHHPKPLKYARAGVLQLAEL